MGLKLVCSFAIMFFLIGPFKAYALNKVYSPIVVKGEKEIEISGDYAFDNRAAHKNARSQKYSVGYGVTDRWATEIFGEVEQVPDEDGVMSRSKFTELAWENRYQLFEQGQYWLDAGLYLEYAKSFEHDHADGLEWEVLLEKSMPHFTHTANFIFSKEVTAHAKKEIEGGAAWSSKWRLNPYFEPGFEYHASFGEIRLRQPYNEQEHQVGPMLYGKVGKVRYELGYLFGISPASPDGMLKWNLELEF